MKIAVCTHDYPDYTSGPNVWLLRFLPELKRQGVDSVVLFTRGGRDRSYRYVRAVADQQIAHHVYAGPNYAESQVRWILEICRAEKPDFLIPNLDIAAHYASRWVRPAGIATIGILHSDHPAYRGILETFVRQPGPYRLDGLVCVSKYLEELGREAPPHGCAVARIPCGVPVPDARAQRKDPRLRLIYAGRLTEKAKRVSLVVRAMCRAVRELPNIEAIVYGSGEEQDAVIRLIAQEGAGYSIRYGGVLAPDEIQRTLLEGHVSVLLSDYEGLPISLMEAMACGLVPVCLNVRSGIPELVRHEETGLMVEDRDDDFVRAIGRLQGEDGLWQRLSSNARELAEREYSIARTTEAWMRLFAAVKIPPGPNAQDLLVPARIDLPPVNPVFGVADTRWPGPARHYARSLRQTWRRLTRSARARLRGLP
jgi:colanic acid/amylovoran biosynthesis glycosyltransferase